MVTSSTDGTTVHRRKNRDKLKFRHVLNTPTAVCVSASVCRCVCVNMSAMIRQVSPQAASRWSSSSLSLFLLIYSTQTLTPPHSATPTSPLTCQSSSHSCFWEGLSEDSVEIPLRSVRLVWNSWCQQSLININSIQCFYFLLLIENSSLAVFDGLFVLFIYFLFCFTELCCCTAASSLWHISVFDCSSNCCLFVEVFEKRNNPPKCAVFVVMTH